MKKNIVLAILALALLVPSTSLAQQNGGHYFFAWGNGMVFDYFSLTRTGGEIAGQYVTVARQNDFVDTPSTSTVDVQGSIDGTHVLLTIAGDQHVRQGEITSGGLVLYGPSSNGIVSGSEFPQSSWEQINSAVQKIEGDQTAAHRARVAADNLDYWNGRIQNAQQTLKDAASRQHADRVSLNDAKRILDSANASLADADKKKSEAVAAQQLYQGKWWSWFWILFHPNVNRELNDAATLANQQYTDAISNLGDAQDQMRKTKGQVATDAADVSNAKKALANATNHVEE